MEKYFDNNLDQQLVALPYWKQLVFLISICQRLLPCFYKFTKESNHQGYDILEEALNKAWTNLLNGKIKVDLSIEQKKCESIAPDTESYDTIFVSLALDSAVSISLLMSAFTKNDTETIIQATSLILDSIDMYIQEIEKMNPYDKKLEEKILQHKLMQNELMKQRKDLELLAKINDDLITSTSILESTWIKKVESCFK